MRFVPYASQPLCITLLALLLAGCASERYLLKEDSSADLTQLGAVLVSIGHVGVRSPYRAYWIEAVSVDKAETRQFMTSPENMFNDGKLTVSSNAGKGDLSAFRMSPGVYLVTKVGAFTDAGPLFSPSITWTLSGDFRFTVRAGEVTYLGFAAFGRGPDKKFVYYVFDEYDRDLAVFRSIRPEFKSTPVRRELLGPELKN
jgi:hypothetical protein